MQKYVSKAALYEFVERGIMVNPRTFFLIEISFKELYQTDF